MADDAMSVYLVDNSGNGYQYSWDKEPPAFRQDWRRRASLAIREVVDSIRIDRENHSVVLEWRTGVGTRWFC